MRIGILYEGLNDEIALMTLLSKILLENEIKTKPIFFPVSAFGGIYTKIKPNLHIFFGSDSKKTDLVVLFSDLDKKPTIEKDIRELVKNNEYSIKGEKIICGFCDPHLEEWFIAEEDAVKHILGYPASQPLPYESLPPKDQLEKLIDNSDLSGDFSLLKRDIYGMIAEKINLKSLSLRSGTFKTFLKEIRESF